MDESNEIFNDRISKAHVQREEFEEFVSLCKTGKAISGMSLEELNLFCSELEKDQVSFSNDMVVDMIIDFVRKNTKDDKLLKIFQHMKIAVVDDSNNIISRAYPKYIDGSYYIEIGEDIDKRIRLLSDIFALLFMCNECDKHKGEYLIIPKLLTVCKDRYIKNDELTNDFNDIQIKLMLWDAFYNEGFTDRFVAYSREINEMALAFLVGHEIGHHYYGHTEKKPKSGNDSKIAELKADGFALEFAVEYLQSAYKNDDDIYGIHFFAGVYLPLIVSAVLSEDICEDDMNHPAIIKRLVGVQRGLKKIIEISAWNEVQEYRRLLLDIIEFSV